MKYSRTLDLILASMREASAGKMQTAAVCFEKALKQKDLPATLAALEAQQAAAFDELKQSNPTVASMFEKVAAKLQKASTSKGKVAAPKGKKQTAADEDFGDTLNDMTLAEDGEDLNGEDFDDITLDDLEGLDDGVDEMPLAAAEDDNDEDEDEDDSEEASDDEDKDDEDGKEESAAKSKITLVSANLDALSRLQEGRKQAPKKSAK